jgi:probable O-glycosylation ligase (exosortase A-associated)
MRDLALLAILLFFSGFALYRPWLGVLGLAVLSFMHPQGYATAFMQTLPVYLILFSVVSVSFLADYVRHRPRLALHWDWRLLGFAIMWSWFAYTTTVAIAPSLAWAKFALVLNILPPLVLVLLLIDTREKLHYLLVIIALSILLVAAKGGYWALMTGFNDRVYGPPGSQFYDNNEFAVAIAMAIPLLVLWRIEVRDRALRLAILAGIVLCYGAALSSWSRGGFLTLTTVTLLLIWHARRNYLVIPALLVVMAGFFVQLPDKWFTRMESLAAVQADQSASNRMEAWKVGLDYTLEHHPVKGSGFDAWPVLTDVRGGSIDWHNAYVKIAVEHGLVGLAIWSLLLFGTLAHLVWLGRLARRRRVTWLWNYTAMLQASLVGYAVGGLTLGITYWELFYWLIATSILLQWIGHGEIDSGTDARPPNMASRSMHRMSEKHT